jgi:hypothetical protein
LSLVFLQAEPAERLLPQFHISISHAADYTIHAGFDNIKKMKLRFLHKVIALTALYFCLFALLAFVQFAGTGGFNRQIGSLRISGSFKPGADGAAALRPVENSVGQAVNDGIRVSFCGMEFNLTGGADNGLAYIDGERHIGAAYPEAITLSKNEARLRLSGGQEISFYVNDDKNIKELTISALIKNDIDQILLPFNTDNKAAFEYNEFGNFTVKYGNEEYTFETPNIDQDTKRILLSRINPLAFYRIVSDNGDTSNFSESIVSGGMEKPFYNEIIQNWCDKAFAYWESRIKAGRADESVVVSYLTEAARRGALIQALDIIPAAFKRESVTFLSSPFLGRLNVSMRGFTSFEKEKITGLASRAKRDLSVFLKEERVFEYLAQRSNYELFETGIEYIKGLPPPVLDLKMCAGVFEGWSAWNLWRMSGENPFGNLLTKTFDLISEHIKKDKVSGYVFTGDDIDVLYNLRLGIALAAYGEETNNHAWAAVGRSLVISVLSFDMVDENASVSAQLEISADGAFTVPNSADKLTAAQIYSKLRYSDFYPHAVGMGNQANGVWLWTVSPAAGAVFANNVLDFNVTFPTGASHYLYILNVKPFSTIQMRNRDWPSDPQFEQYDAPGWLYSASEQILMVKMLHKEEIERLRILY